MSLSDAELKAKTSYFKSKLNEGVSLDSLLIEAFACLLYTSDAADE